MKSTDRSTIKSAVRGVAQIVETDRGLKFSRLPEWTYPQHSHAPIVAKMAERLSGARIDIETSGSEVVVTYRSTRDSNPAFNWAAGPTTIALTAPGFEQSISHTNGDLRVWDGLEIKETITGEDSVATFRLPEANEPRPIQLWLSQDSPIELISIEVNAPWIAAPKTSQPNWVHYGSSISHCEDADGPLGVWPVAASRALGLDLYNLSLGGCANLEQYSARTIRDLDADVISLKLGINVVNGANHTERTFGPAVDGFIDTIREGHPAAPILVISPVCCPGHETNPGPSETLADGKVVGQQFGRHEWIGELTLQSIRVQLKNLVERRASTDPNIFYMDGLELFNEVEAQTMPDGIHPDADGYKTIAKHFVERYPKQWLAEKWGAGK